MATSTRSLVLLLTALCVGGCATGTTALWRAGASPKVDEVDLPKKAPGQIEVYFKEEFGSFEETQSRRYFACATTTVLRKSMLVPRAWIEEAGLPARFGEPERDHDALANLTTEEYPRDEAKSKILGEAFGTTFGSGKTPFDLFEIQMDKAFLKEAVARLQQFASKLGADAVVDVFVTGEAEHHMWEGGGLSFDARSTSSLFYVSGKLLGFQLRDVRLHGTAVTYEE